MKILSILPFSSPNSLIGGTERQMDSLHKGLQARGINLHVLAEISNVGKANEPPRRKQRGIKSELGRYARCKWRGVGPEEIQMGRIMVGCLRPSMRTAQLGAGAAL